MSLLHFILAACSTFFAKVNSGADFASINAAVMRRRRCGMSMRVNKQKGLGDCFIKMYNAHMKDCTLEVTMTGMFKQSDRCPNI
jgi:hypothetical protein